MPGGRCVGCVPPCRRQVRGCPLPCPAMASGTPRDGRWDLLLLPLLRARLSAFPPGFKCPICSKSVASDEMEMHFIMCLSKPRLSYNGKGRWPGCAGTRRPVGLGWLRAGWRDACRRLHGRRLGWVCQEGCASADRCSSRSPLRSAPPAWLNPAAFAFGTLCNTAPSPCCSPWCAVPEGAVLAGRPAWLGQGTCVLLGCPSEESLPSSPPHWR